MVVVEGLRPTLWGVVAGVISALMLGRLIAAMVFGVSPHDGATLTAVAALLTLVGVIASLVPAYRATCIAVRYRRNGNTNIAFPPSPLFPPGE
jgi:hypothetical protein